MSRTLLTDERDIPLLKFLWRWKLATTAMLTEKFFTRCNPKTAYRRLGTLRKAGFIRIHSDSQQAKYVWLLGKVGFNTIKEMLPLRESETYRSEHIAHDLVVTVTHLGDWLLNTPEKVEMASEQELRSLHPDMLPDWVPKSTSRRPDGYWRVPIRGEMATIALEVELSLKRNVDYEIIGDFYAYHPEITRTLWIAETLTAAKKIEKNIRATIGKKPFTHDFVILSELRTLLWQAPMVIGPERGSSISSLLQIKKGNCQPAYVGMSLLDTRKCISKSNNYKIFQKGDFSE